ncbi:hypothetical protein J6590_027810 [Homalodisca vitripennis]|nr:hypothetical protein J6590_027810 [Homalodisca vitripennis]
MQIRAKIFCLKKCPTRQTLYLNSIYETFPCQHMTAVFIPQTPIVDYELEWTIKLLDICILSMTLPDLSRDPPLPPRHLSYLLVQRKWGRKVMGQSVNNLLKNTL